LVLSSEYFPDYGKIRDEIHVRISDLPIVDTLRDLRQNHLNQYVPSSIIKAEAIYDRRLVRVSGVT